LAQTDVLIVGGGLAGLACAVGLRGSGLRVTLLEGDVRLGGRAQSWRDAQTGDVIDIGPHVLLTEYHNMLSLLDVLGTRDRVVWQTDKLITLLDDHHPTDIRVHRLPPPLHLAPSLLKPNSVTLRDKASNATAVWLAMKTDEPDVPDLDAQSGEQLLRDLGVSERFIDWFWRSASMALMNVPLEQCSAGALMRFFSQFVGHNDYAFGFAGCGLGELFLPAAEDVIEGEGGEILTSTMAAAFLQTDGVCTGVQLADGRSLHARHSVAAVPPAALRKLTPSRWLEFAAFRATEEFEPSPYISVYLWFDRKLTDEQFWARVWSPENVNYDFYDLSNIRPGWNSRPAVIASNIIYSHRVAGWSDEQIIAATVREIADFAPEAARARLRHALVNRIPMAIPCPHPGTENLRPETLTPVKGLLLAGDWTRTHLPCSMESAVRSGFLAAEQIWRDIGQPRELALALRPTQGIAGLVRRFSQRSLR
jgi:squalene-associated FAD-dependent desaturase